MNVVVLIISMLFVGHNFVFSASSDDTSASKEAFCVTDLLRNSQDPPLPYKETHQVIDWRHQGKVNFIHGYITLDLSGKGLTSLAGLSDIPEIGTVQELYLDDNYLTSLTASDLFCLKQMHLLHVNNNRLTTIDHNAFEGLLQLKGLFLQKNELKDIAAIMSVLHRITNLDLADNKIEDFKPVKMNPGFISLCLNNNKLSEQSDHPWILSMCPLLKSYNTWFFVKERFIL